MGLLMSVYSIFSTNIPSLWDFAEIVLKRFLDNWFKEKFEISPLLVSSP
jgi:hypothetical protein